MEPDDFDMDIMFPAFVDGIVLGSGGVPYVPDYEENETHSDEDDE